MNNKIENIDKKIDELRKEIIKLEEEKKTINIYESMAILKITTKIKTYEDIKNKIKEIVDVSNFDEIGTKKMAYEIRKQTEGFYIRFDFIANNKQFAQLEKFYRLNNNIIKFINIRQDEQ